MAVPNKIKHFLWLLNHNILSCNSILSRRGIPIQPDCNKCSNSHEKLITFSRDACKLFTFGLSYLSSWTVPPNLMGINEDNLLNATKYWFQNKPFDSHISLDVLIVYCLWEIWKCRNKNVHNNTNSIPTLENTYVVATEYTHLTKNHEKPNDQTITIFIK